MIPLDDVKHAIRDKSISTPERAIYEIAKLKAEHTAMIDAINLVLDHDPCAVRCCDAVLACIHARDEMRFEI